jgi:TrmH family RNA methyltransferase
MEITSVNNQLIKETVKLHKRKYREDRQVFIVEGYHLYEEANKVNLVRQVFTTDRSIIGNNVVYVTDIVLGKLSQMKTPQSIVAVCNKPNNKELTDRVLILEKLQDPGNVGTLIRSALAFGFKTIVLDSTVDIYNDKVIRSTQGAMFKLNFIEMSALEFIKTHRDYNIFGTSLDGEEIDNVVFSGKIALVLGNEGNGISNEVLANTNRNVTIKTNEVESLNVGVAGSIVMHEVSKQR